jgi:ketosteroid isomerase-like protein
MVFDQTRDKLYSLGKPGVLNMLMKSVTKLIVIMAVTSSFAFAQSSKNRRAKIDNAEQEIKKLERERFNAYLKLDASALERIMSDDYTSVYADGQLVTKAQEIEGIKSAPTGTLSSVSATIDQLSVRHFETSALLIGRLMIKGKIIWSEKDININAAFRYTAVYVKKQGHWRVVASQFTKIDESTDK